MAQRVQKWPFLGSFGVPGPWAPPGGPIKKPKRSFVHHGLLKSSYKFHSNRIKIVGLHSFGAKYPKMALLGPWGPGVTPIGKKKKTSRGNRLRYLRANFEANRSSPSTLTSCYIHIHIWQTPCDRISSVSSTKWAKNVFFMKEI